MEVRALKQLADVADKGMVDFKRLVDAANGAGYQVCYQTAYYRWARGWSAFLSVTAPPKSQNNNLLRFGNAQMTIKEAARKFGVPYQTIISRRNRHPDWPAEWLISGGE